MRKLLVTLSILIFIAFTAPCFAQQQMLGVLARKNVAGGAIYLAETFETSEYDTTGCGAAPCYTEAGAPDGDTNTAGLDMVGSLCLTVDPTEGLFFTLADDDEYYVTFRARYSETLESNEIFMQIFGNNGANLLGMVYVSTAGKPYAKAQGGSNSADLGAVFTATTSLYFKVRYKHVGAANNEIELWYWNGAAWSASVSNLTGTTNYDIDTILFLNSADAEIFYFDHIKVSTTNIADPT